MEAFLTDHLTASDDGTTAAVGGSDRHNEAAGNDRRSPVDRVARLVGSHRAGPRFNERDRRSVGAPGRADCRRARGECHRQARVAVALTVKGDAARLRFGSVANVIVCATFVTVKPRLIAVAAA